MYMPVLRGKRFELLALRDLAAEGAISANVVPIIEPVRTETIGTDLRRAIAGWLDSGGSLGVVVNPGVGGLESQTPVNDVLSELAIAYDADWGDLTGTIGPVRERLIPVLAVATDPVAYARGLKVIKEKLGAGTPVILWLRDAVSSHAIAKPAQESGLVVTQLLVSEARAGKRIARDFDIAPGVVVFDDPFPRKTSNADYLDQREQVFTEEHIYFRDDGLAGFCDYGTIGKDFRDGGGAPKYVVIHWTYQRRGQVTEDSPVYLQHFCSDDEDVVAPVHAKYDVASKKLVDFCARERVFETLGMRVLREYYEEGAFPGLGMLKKMSIMNHLAVVDRALGDKSL